MKFSLVVFFSFAIGMQSSMWCDTHQQNLNGSFSPLLTLQGLSWGKGLRSARCSRNKDDDDGSVGVQVHESKGGDLGHGGDRGEEPAICLGP